MIIRLIEQNSSLLGRLREINDEAFTDNERMNVEDMYNLQGRSEVLGFFENERLIGFALVLINDAVVFIVLLAIDRRFRGRGYGTKALSSVRKRFPDRQIVLDFAEVNENSADYAQRAARKHFYLKNGFYETGRYTVLSGERYEVVCSDEVLNEEAFLDLLSVIHRRTSEFDERLFSFGSDEDEEFIYAIDVEVDEISARLIAKNVKAYEELAK